MLFYYVADAKNNENCVFFKAEAHLYACKFRDETQWSISRFTPKINVAGSRYKAYNLALGQRHPTPCIVHMMLNKVKLIIF